MAQALLRRLQPLSVLLVAGVLIACGAAEPAGIEPEPWLELGRSGGSSGIEFVPLSDGGEVPLETFGQGGRHVLLALRVGGLGERAFIRLTLTAPQSERVVHLGDDQPARLLFCPEAAEACELAPWLVSTDGLEGAVEPGGLVQVLVEAESLDGRTATLEQSIALTRD